METLTIQSTGWDTLPNHSRVWVYQSNRALVDDELDELTKALEEFMQRWNTHGTKLAAGYRILHDRFIVLCVDELHQHASGCSIDSSVKLLKELGAKFNLDFFDRTTIVYKGKAGELLTTSLAEFSHGLEEGIFDENTIVFNNLVDTKEAFEKSHESIVGNSWHKQLLR